MKRDIQTDQRSIISGSGLNLDPKSDNSDRSGAIIVKEADEYSDIELSITDLLSLSSKEIRTLFSYREAEKFRVFLISYDTRREHIAAIMPKDGYLERVSLLKFTLNRSFKTLFAPRDLVEAAIYKAYKGDEESLTQKRLLDVRSDRPRTVPSKVEWKFDGENEVVNLLTSVVEYAIAVTASDLHIEPSELGTSIRVRVSGILLHRSEVICSQQQHLHLVNRVKVLAGLDISKRAIPQDGTLSVPIFGRERQVRIGILPTIFGERIVLRIPPGDLPPDLNDLGFEPDLISWLKRSMIKRQGVVLICGKVGSGKSTTLYSMAYALSRDGLHVASIEDPVERQIPGITQVEVREEGIDFSTAIRSILRQDPEAIFVGEIRDRDSAEAIINAALTGHLVVSSVHAPDAISAIYRLSRLGVDIGQLCSVLSLTVWQALVPKLCSRCKVLDLTRAHLYSTSLYKSVGCTDCNGLGYDGRLLAYEAISMRGIPVQDILSDLSSFNLCSVRETLIGSGRYKSNLEQIKGRLINGEVGLQDLERLFG